jgi:hypothetical protein
MRDRPRSLAALGAAAGLLVAVMLAGVLAART